MFLWIVIYTQILHTSADYGFRTSFKWSAVHYVFAIKSLGNNFQINNNLTTNFESWRTIPHFIWREKVKTEMRDLPHF